MSYRLVPESLIPKAEMELAKPIIAGVGEELRVSVPLFKCPVISSFEHAWASTCTSWSGIPVWSDLPTLLTQESLQLCHGGYVGASCLQIHAILSKGTLGPTRAPGETCRGPPVD